MKVNFYIESKKDEFRGKRIKQHLSLDCLGPTTTIPFQREDKKEADSQTATRCKLFALQSVHRCSMLQTQPHRTALVNRGCKPADDYLCKQRKLFYLCFPSISTLRKADLKSKKQNLIRHLIFLP